MGGKEEGGPDLGGKEGGQPDLGGKEGGRPDLGKKEGGWPDLDGKGGGRPGWASPSSPFPEGFSVRGEHVLWELRSAETWY